MSCCDLDVALELFEAEVGALIVFGDGRTIDVLSVLVEAGGEARKDSSSSTGSKSMEVSFVSEPVFLF